MGRGSGPASPSGAEEEEEEEGVPTPAVVDVAPPNLAAEARGDGGQGREGGREGPAAARGCQGLIEIEVLQEGGKGKSQHADGHGLRPRTWSR